MAQLVVKQGYNFTGGMSLLEAQVSGFRPPQQPQQIKGHNHYSSLPKHKQPTRQENGGYYQPIHHERESEISAWQKSRRNVNVAKAPGSCFRMGRDCRLTGGKYDTTGWRPKTPEDLIQSSIIHKRQKNANQTVSYLDPSTMTAFFNKSQ